MDIIGNRIEILDGETGKKPTQGLLKGNSKYNKNKSNRLIDYKQS